LTLETFGEHSLHRTIEFEHGRGMTRYGIVIHGGCGEWEASATAAALAGVRRAAQIGQRILAGGGSALDAVCAAAVVLEDDPLFNAGTGSTLNIDGEAEMDASIMVGHGLRCGGVAAIRRVRNPILVARKVMETTPHCLLAGAGALAFARATGFADYDPVTAERRRGHDRARNAAGMSAAGTIGAIALDRDGGFAAATSTGGTTLKIPGRIGDSPIPGAGNYATDRAAASATGHGELMLRTLATKTVCDLIGGAKTAGVAAQLVVSGLPMESGQSAGIIAIDSGARVGVAMRGGVMPHAWYVEGKSVRAIARMRA
jgi:beta-aspartyl-peptidase (threonine type)